MPEFASLNLRAASAADAPSIRALVRSAYAKWVAVIGREPLPMVADYERAVREHEIDLLHADGELIALIELIQKPDHLFVENLAVAPAHQGLGIGRALLGHAERKGRSRGVPELRLLTNAAFEGNVRLYKSTGYRIDRREPFRGGVAVYMSKQIA